MNIYLILLSGALAAASPQKHHEASLYCGPIKGETFDAENDRWKKCLPLYRKAHPCYFTEPNYMGCPIPRPLNDVYDDPNRTTPYPNTRFFVRDFKTQPWRETGVGFAVDHGRDTDCCRFTLTPEYK